MQYATSIFSILCIVIRVKCNPCDHSIYVDAATLRSLGGSANRPTDPIHPTHERKFDGQSEGLNNGHLHACRFEFAAHFPASPGRWCDAHDARRATSARTVTHCGSGHLFVSQHIPTLSARWAERSIAVLEPFLYSAHSQNDTKSVILEM